MIRAPAALAVQGEPALSRSTVDRAAHRRPDAPWLAESWAGPTTRAFAIADGLVLVDVSGAPRLVLSSPADLGPGERLFLGTDQGAAYFAVRTTPPAPRPGQQLLGLRDVGAVLPAREAGLLTHAVALAAWHDAHPRCPRCGTPTESASGGAERRCPADGSAHFPRVDPAVIMLVSDGADRVVLGRAPSWPTGRFSILAGFVEPGESLEAAVGREVAEEVGLEVRDVRYVASQPWPFPSSLMLAFTARAEPWPLRPDPHELAEARWVSRAELRTGAVLLPPPVSIARWLLDAWLAAPAARSG